MPAAASSRPRVPLHTKILLGLLLGAASGTASNLLWHDAPRLLWSVDNVFQPVGQIFLRMLFMVVVPLVFTSVTLGVASLGDVRRIGRVGTKTLLYFLATTAIRTSLLQQYSAQAGERVAAAGQTGFGINTFVNIVPRNPVAAAANGDMLGLIFFSLIFGIALTLIAETFRQPVMAVLEGIAQAVMVMINFAMKLAPIGVFGLIFSVTARFGYDLLGSLLLYVLTVLLGLLIHQFGVIPVLARTLAGISPLKLLKGARELMITAFSTSSSNATLPTTIKTATLKFGVPDEIAGFVLPVGATMNMNGTALFEGVTAVFLAQVFGIHLTIGRQLLLLIFSVISAVGAAGIPGGSIPLLVLVISSVGVPPEGIAIIIGVDRILDMCRTTLNVTGDAACAAFVARSEGFMPKRPLN
jgi:DAACS family dicarboxylate/amino acid:cation (Na+ or H+) symporter